MSTFADRLRKALDSAGMKPAELSEATGIGKSSISTYLQGLYEPKMINLYKMAEALNVNPDYLLCRVDDPRDYENDPVLANIPVAWFRQFNGDIEAAIKAYEATDADREKGAQAPHANGNGEFSPYREQLRRQPGARMLLDAASDVTDEEIQDWVNVINVLKKNKRDD